MRRRQQQERVDVASRGTAGAPVQAGDGAAGVPRFEDADHRPAHDDGAGHDRRRHGLVGRAQPVGVLDGDHAAPGEPPREHDHAEACGEHGGARGTGQVDAPVPRTEPVGGLLERSQDDGDGQAEWRPVHGTRDRGHRSGGRPRCRCGGGGERGVGWARLPCVRRARRGPDGDDRQRPEQRGAHHRPSRLVSPPPRAARPDRPSCPHVGTVARRRGAGQGPGPAVDEPTAMWTTRRGHRTRERAESSPGVCW